MHARLAGIGEVGGLRGVASRIAFLNFAHTYTNMCTCTHRHTHTLRQPVSEWQVIGQVLCRHAVVWGRKCWGKAGLLRQAKL